MASSLHPIATYDPAAQYRTNVFWSRVWKVALITSIVAFTALAVAAVGLTSTLWPSHLPIVTLMVLAGGLPLSSGIVSRLWSKADLCSRESKYDLMLQKNMEALPDGEISSRLKSLGINSTADQAVQKRLITRHELLEQESQKSLELSKLDDEVTVYVDKSIRRVNQRDYQIAKVNFQDPDQVEIFEALQNKQISAQRALHDAALQHLKAAYMLHLIQSPQDQRNLIEFVRLTSANPLQHMIAMNAGDPSADVVAVTDSRNYTHKEILATSTDRLAKQIFGTKIRRWF